jgi:hypothetical protein
LNAAGGYLVVDESAPEWGTHLLLLGSPGGLAEAENLYRQNPQTRVLLIQKRPGRPMQLGVLPSYESFMLQQLAERGIQATAVDVIAAQASDEDSHAAALADWLEGHPDVRVVAVVPRLSGRSWRRAFHRALSAESVERIRIHAPVDEAGSTAGWWRRKNDIIQVIKQYVSLAYTSAARLP